MLFIPHVFTIILSEKNGNSHSNYTNTLWVEDEKNENFNFLDSSLDPLATSLINHLSSKFVFARDRTGDLLCVRQM